MRAAADNLPVIVGVGQLTSKVSDVGAAPSPLEMLEAVSYRAAADAGLDSLRAVDTIASLPVFYWDEPNPAAALAEHLKLDVRRQILTGDGGEIGVVLLNWIAGQILDGRAGTAVQDLPGDPVEQHDADLAAVSGQDLTANVKFEVLGQGGGGVRFVPVEDGQRGDRVDGAQ